MNKVVKNLFLWFFILIISITFIAYFGITGDPISYQGGKIATVNGVEIYNTRNSEFSDNFQLIYENYQNQLIDISDQVSQYISQQAFQQTIINQLIVEKAIENNFQVSDKTKLLYILKTYFSNDLKEFNVYKGRGDKTLQVNIEKKANRKLLRNFYEQSLFSSIPTSEKELDFIFVATSSEKKVIVSSFNWKSKLDQVDEKKLRDYYQNNINRYQRKSKIENSTQLDKKNPLFLDMQSINQSNSNIAPTEGGEDNSLPIAPNLDTDNFIASKDKVLEDYILENETLIVEEIRNNIDFTFKAIKDRNPKEISNVFIKTARDLEMKIQISDFFSYDARTINELSKDDVEEGEVTSIVDSANLIKSLFQLDKNEISEIYNIEDKYFVVLILDEKKSVPRSNFVKKRYKEELKGNTQKRLENAFYVSLLANAKIEMN